MSIQLKFQLGVNILRHIGPYKNAVGPVFFFQKLSILPNHGDIPGPRIGKHPLDKYFTLAQNVFQRLFHIIQAKFLLRRNP